MTRQQYITYGLLGLFAIGVIIILVVLFKGKGSTTNQDLIKQLIAAKDSVIKKEADKVVLYERLIEEKERTNEALQGRDSILNVHYNETEKLYKNLNAKLNDIPNRINRIATNNDSLRIILSNY